MAEFTLFDSLRRLRRCDETVPCLRAVTGALDPLADIFHPEELQFDLDLGRIFGEGEFLMLFSADRTGSLLFRNLYEHLNYRQIFGDFPAVSLVARLSAAPSFWMLDTS